MINATPSLATLTGEQMVIGAVLLDPATFQDVAGIVTEGDFADPACRKVFRAASALFAAGQPVTYPAVLARLGSDQAATDCAADTRAGTGSAAEAAFHAGLVAEAARRRALAAAGQAIADAATEHPGDFAAALAASQATLQTVLDGPAVAGPVALADGLADHLRGIELHQAAGGGLRGLSLGLRALDGITLGLRPGQVAVVGGPTGSGKSALALQVADHVAEGGGRVLYFSAEMPRADLIERVLARRAGVPHSRIRAATLAPAEWSRIVAAAATWSAGAGSRFLVDDCGGVTPGRIAAALARERARGGIALVVVDHLQLCRLDSGRAPSRYELLTELSGAMKSLSLRFEVPFLILSQLSRAAGQAGRRPGLSDLRDSGAIEQDADLVCLLERDAAAVDRLVREAVTLAVCKNRSGRLGEIRLRFNLEHQSFSEAEVLS